jgi:hypothetical protein
MNVSRSMEMGGALGIKKIGAPKVGLDWKIRNLPNIMRAWRIVPAKLLGIPTYYGKLDLRIIKADGSVVDYGNVGYRVLSTAFVVLMTDQLQTETSVWGDFKYHDCGTGVVAENITDAGMGTQATVITGDERIAGTQIEGASTNIYKSVATVPFDGAGAITEHGLFNAVRGGGTLMDRTVFAAVNVASGDSISFSFELTCTAGG